MAAPDSRTDEEIVRSYWKTVIAQPSGIVDLGTTVYHSRSTEPKAVWKATAGFTLHRVQTIHHILDDIKQIELEIEFNSTRFPSVTTTVKHMLVLEEKNLGWERMVRRLKADLLCLTDGMKGWEKNAE